jgi:hypothetical protein
MVGIALSGGMGNQMFEYAFIYSEAKKHNTQFFLNKRGTPIELYRYFKLEHNTFYIIDHLFFNVSSFKLLFSHYLRKYFYYTLKKLVITTNKKIDNDCQPLTGAETRDKTFYTGYFQSPFYFSGYEADIRKVFTVKEKLVSNYQKKYKEFKGRNIIAVHIRKADYNNLAHLNLGQKDLSLPFSYFKNIIKEIHSVNNYYVFVSDDIELVKPQFQYLDNAYFSGDDTINDFLHLFFADTVIISNSTFSWWAAYLNNNPNKKVYCPKYFLGYIIQKEYPVNIYPDDFVQVDVVLNKETSLND